MNGLEKRLAGLRALASRALRALANWMCKIAAGLGSCISTYSTHAALGSIGSSNDPSHMGRLC